MAPFLTASPLKADGQPLESDPAEVEFGIIPQARPLWIPFSLYRFESNVRAATVPGIVGAGGIGMILWDHIRGVCSAATSAVRRRRQMFI